MHTPFVSRFLILALLLFSGCGEAFSGVNFVPRDAIRIAYAEAPSTFSPLSYEAKNRKFIGNIYEPLVTFDGTFNLESALAVSWGRLDDNTWDFHLRQDVFFHDGRSFSAADVAYSLDLARGEGSELKPLLSTIASVQVLSEDRLQIETNEPDALLLNRLTYAFIVPEGSEDFSLPVGTGPYRVHAFVADGLSLERFEDYWGPLAYFSGVHLKTVVDPAERVLGLEKGEVQVLANVPPQSVSDLEAADFKVEAFPSLEVSYLFLNQSRVFKDSRLREAVYLALSTDYAQRLGGDYLLPTSQFSATGIEGYRSHAEAREQNVGLALQLRSQVEGPVSVVLDLPQGLDRLGELIVRDLGTIDIEVTVNLLESAALQEKIESGLSDFYFFGWKYDLADNADFFEAAVHSKTGVYGQFNGIAYADADLDGWIEAAAHEFSLIKRRALILQVEEQLRADHAIVPLFESKILYAFDQSVLWNSRLDGQLWATDLVENVLK